jgi:hypothetical protein
MASLEERFLRFARQLPYAEAIDELELTPEQERAKHADFFFKNRAVIVEVKTLKTNTKPKIDQILEPYRNTPAWPEFYGKWDLNKVLAHLPEPDRIRQEIANAVASAVPELVRRANQQLRATKTTFNRPNAEGVLVLLNDILDALPPETIIGILDRELGKRTPDGTSRYPAIRFTWMMAETHTVPLVPGVLNGYPMALLENPHHPGTPTTRDYLLGLGEPWASFNHLPLAVAPNVPFHSEPAARPPAGPQRRQEHWEAAYRARPYLQHLPKTELFAHGARLIRELAPHFRKDGTKLPIPQRNELFEQVTHFMQEINDRGIPLPEWGPQVRDRVALEG